jgi:hypothetical protein
VATQAEATRKAAVLARLEVIKKGDLPRLPVSGVKPACPEITGRVPAVVEPRGRLRQLMVVHAPLAAVALLAEVGGEANAS